MLSFVYSQNRNYVLSLRAIPNSVPNSATSSPSRFPSYITALPHRRSCFVILSLSLSLTHSLTVHGTGSGPTLSEHLAGKFSTDGDENGDVPGEEALAATIAAAASLAEQLPSGGG